MGTSNLNNYQYYGLVGQGFADAASSVSAGIANASAYEIQAGGYAASAEAMDIQAQQELINGEAGANHRMEQYNQSAAANAALIAVMGRTDSGMVDRVNEHNAKLDASLMRRNAKMRNISARSSAVAKRGAAEQSKIAAKSAEIQGILGGISGIAGAVGSGAMIGGSSKSSKSKG